VSLSSGEKSGRDHQFNHWPSRSTVSAACT
jgi:hypothetical protein